MTDRVLSMLGLAAKSGNVVSGEFSTEKAVKTGKAFLVIGNAIGKEFRASLAVTDENLANAVIKKLQSNKTE